jgi:hypothetical protein
MTDAEFERKIQQLENDAEGDFADAITSLLWAARGRDADSRRLLTAYVLKWPDAERQAFARHLLGDAAQQSASSAKIIVRTEPDNRRDGMLWVTCPGCHRYDSTGLVNEVLTGTIQCGYCGTVSHSSEAAQAEEEAKTR